MRVGSLLSRAPSFIAEKASLHAPPVAATNSAEEDDYSGGLAVTPKPLSQLYTQPPLMEGGELQPIFQVLIKRDRDLVSAGTYFLTEL